MHKTPNTLEPPPIRTQPTKLVAKHQKNALRMCKALLANLEELVIQPDLSLLQTQAFLSSEKKRARIYCISDDKHQQMLSATVESIFGLRVGFGSPQYVNEDHIEMLQVSNMDGDIMQLFRSLRCDACCCPCSLQKLEIFAPPQKFFGTVEQTFNLFRPEFSVKNSNGDLLVKVIGHSLKMDFYKIVNANDKDVGVIRRKTMSQMKKESYLAKEGFSLFFKSLLDADEKLMILAATILIDCMYWETPVFLRNSV